MTTGEVRFLSGPVEECELGEWILVQDLAELGMLSPEETAEVYAEQSRIRTLSPTEIALELPALSA